MQNNCRQASLVLVVLCILIMECNLIASQSPTAPLANEGPVPWVGLFPPRTLDESSAKWWTHVLQVCSESSLQTSSDEVSAVASYRLVNHSPTGYFNYLVVRIYIDNDDEGQIVVKGVLEDGTMLSNETRHLQRTQVAAFRKVIEDASFWTTPTNDQEPPNSRVKDWGTFIIEGIQRSTYHIAWRRTYEKESLNVLERYFLTLAFQR
jgi:hypothetical protein